MRTPNDDDPAEDAVVLAFFERVAADRDKGTVASLAHYQQLFPGYEAAIAREFALLTPQSAPSSARVASLSDLEVALRHRRYRALGELGRGGMGIVLHVWDEHLQRPLAMKVLAEQRPDSGGEFAGTGSQRLGRFLDEAQVTGQLAHPGVVPVHDLGIDEDGRVYFTMSRIQGQDLRGIIRRLHAGDPTWSQARVLGIVLRVCEAVAFAHANGIVHRDLKPANVMVGEFGETYVLDWGLARVRAPAPAVSQPSAGGDGADAELRTQDGDVVGTPAFMAPEQARGEAERVGPRSDVYSLGAMIYDVVAGRAPYSDLATTSRGVLALAVERPPTPLEDLSRDVAPELAAVCKKAMAQRCEKRYPSVEALADDLRAFLEVRVVRAYESGTVAEARKWIRRNKALAGTGLAAFLALAGGLAVSLVQKSAADANAARADSNALRADADFGLAHTIVDEMVARFADRSLLDVPQMEAVRSDLLGRALDFYRELLARRRADPKSRAAVPAALLRVSAALRELGKYDDAASATGEAIDLMQASSHAAGDGTAQADELAQARTELAFIHTLRGQYGAAVDLLQTCRQDLDAALKVAPDAWALLRRKGDALTKLTVALSRAGRWSEILDFQSETVALGERLLAMQPDDFDACAMTCVALQNLSVVLGQLGRTDEAMQAIERARVLVEAAPPAWTEKRRWRALVGDVWGTLARWQSRSDVKLAMASLDEEIRIRRAQVRDFPGVPEHHSTLARTLFNYGTLLLAEKDVEGGIARVEEAAASHARSVELAPSNPFYARFLAETHRRLAQILLRAGHHVRAAEHARALGTTVVAGASDDPGAVDDGAYLLTQCIAAAEDDTTLSTEQRASAREAYAHDAVGLLRTALTAGLDAIDRSKYQALHGRADFEALPATRRQK
ncbi:MAG: serine/threonine-protein kinase [Planctomycetota bacterium]